MYWGYNDFRSIHEGESAFWLTRQMMENVPYPALFAGVTGSHMWGLATPEADVDIRGIYVKPTEQILELHKGRDTIERNGFVDVQFYEIEKACKMLLAHNGNLIELALSPSIFYISHLGLRFKGIAERYLTKRLRHYYRGYATSQRRRAAENRGGKSLVYAFREIFAGIWLAHKGVIEYNFRTLWENMMSAGLYTGDFLTEVFARPKWEIVAADDMKRFNAEWEELVRTLDDEMARSSLPDDYDGYRELNDLLLTARRDGVFLT